MPADVTGRDVAAAVALPLQDQQLICNALNEEVAVQGYAQATYSPVVRVLLQRAWAVAAHRQSSRVTIFHIAYVLAFDHPEVGVKLAEHLESDVDAFAVGCIFLTLPLGRSTGDAAVVPPSVGAARWVGSAAELARKRGKQSEVAPEDLVNAVLDGALPAVERYDLRKAARVGKARLDTVLGPRSRSPDIIADMEGIVKEQSAVPSADDGGTDVADLISLIAEFERRSSADADAQKQALASLQTLFEQRLSLIEGRKPVTLEGVLAKLTAIENRIARVEDALPQPPSGRLLAAIVVAALVLGSVAGIGLTYSQTGSLAAQIFSARTK